MGRTVVRELTDLVRQGHEIGGTIEAIAGALDRHESPSGSSRTWSGATAA